MILVLVARGMSRRRYQLFRNRGAAEPVLAELHQITLNYQDKAAVEPDSERPPIVYSLCPVFAIIDISKRQNESPDQSSLYAL